jgi:uncharacterized protein YdeI (YjbR/CyaY-like superfamily)
MTEAVDSPLVFSTLGRWRQWLRRNHARQAGAWVLIAKKGVQPGIGYHAALEEALCWGWIDGKIHRYDERHFVQWFSPRRPRSLWSLANRGAFERLAAEGRMQPAGLVKVAEAKRSGRWEAAYASAAPPRMSADVRGALRESGAERPETRARRIAQLPALVKERRLAGFGPA